MGHWFFTANAKNLFRSIKSECPNHFESKILEKCICLNEHFKEEDCEENVVLYWPGVVGFLTANVVKLLI